MLNEKNPDCNSRQFCIHTSRAPVDTVWEFMSKEDPHTREHGGCMHRTWADELICADLYHMKGKMCTVVMQLHTSSQPHIKRVARGSEFIGCLLSIQFITDYFTTNSSIVRILQRIMGRLVLAAILLVAMVAVITAKPDRGEPIL